MIPSLRNIYVWSFKLPYRKLALGLEALSDMERLKAWTRRCWSAKTCGLRGSYPKTKVRKILDTTKQLVLRTPLVKWFRDRKHFNQKAMARL